MRFPYEIRNAASCYENWDDDATRDEAMRLDVMRIFARKDLRLESTDKNAVKLYLDNAIMGSARSITRLADEMIIGQWIGAAMAAAG
jgi:hypothetical protein